MLSHKLSQLISELDYIQDFQAAKARLEADTTVWTAYQQMKELQKEAVLFKQIGKFQAFKETSSQAQRIEKSLKLDAKVQDYLSKMADCYDLLTYVTDEIERQVNEKLES